MDGRVTESRPATDVHDAKLVGSARSGKPHRTRRHHRRNAGVRSSSSSQFDDREMLAVDAEADVKFEPNTAPTTNSRLGSGAPRATWPSCSRFEAGSEASGWPPEVDLVRCPHLEPSVWPIAVKPLDEQRQFTPERVATVRNDQPTCALVFDRPDESFDDCKTSVLTDGSEALMDALPTTPSSKRPVAKLLALVGDQVPRTHSRLRNDSAKKRPHCHGCGLLVEHSEPHDAT